jgi:hypothetical protein
MRFFVVFLTVLASQLLGQTTMPAAASDDPYAPLKARGIECVDFSVAVRGFRVPAIIASPPKDKLDPNPVLLLTIGGPSSHLVPPNQQPAEYFLQRGHRAVSFPVGSMPGDLEKLRDMALQGQDPFGEFVEIAQAVLKHCVDQGWAKPDRIVVTGISRYAYLAFRLMAADERLKIGGGFAPVTDWRDLREFSDQRDRKDIADLRLSMYADKLAGRKIFLVIGSHDERVSTRSCCQFFLDLNDVNKRRGFGPDLVDLYVTPDPDHRCGDEWFERGMEILLKAATAGDVK